MQHSPSRSINRTSVAAILADAGIANEVERLCEEAELYLPSTEAAESDALLGSLAWRVRTQMRQLRSASLLGEKPSPASDELNAITRNSVEALPRWERWERIALLKELSAAMTALFRRIASSSHGDDASARNDNDIKGAARKPAPIRSHSPKSTASSPRDADGKAKGLSAENKAQEQRGGLLHSAGALSAVSGPVVADGAVQVPAAGRQTVPRMLELVSAVLRATEPLSFFENADGERIDAALSMLRHHRDLLHGVSESRAAIHATSDPLPSPLRPQTPASAHTATTTATVSTARPDDPSSTAAGPRSSGGNLAASAWTPRPGAARPPASGDNLASPPDAQRPSSAKAPPSGDNLASLPDTAKVRDAARSCIVRPLTEVAAAEAARGVIGANADMRIARGPPAEALRRPTSAPSRRDDPGMSRRDDSGLGREDVRGMDGAFAAVPTLVGVSEIEEMMDAPRFPSAFVKTRLIPVKGASVPELFYAQVDEDWTLLPGAWSYDDECRLLDLQRKQKRALREMGMAPRGLRPYTAVPARDDMDLHELLWADFADAVAESNRLALAAAYQTEDGITARYKAALKMGRDLADRDNLLRAIDPETAIDAAASCRRALACDGPS